MSRVLIIEDDPLLGRLLTIVLGLEGYLAQVALDGEIGLAEAITQDYDLLILDLGLPYIDGLTLLRRAHSAGVTTPAIVLSGSTSSALARTALGLGACKVLRKPVGPRELLEAVRDVVPAPAPNELLTRMMWDRSTDIGVLEAVN